MKPISPEPDEWPDGEWQADLQETWYACKSCGKEFNAIASYCDCVRYENFAGKSVETKRVDWENAVYLGMGKTAAEAKTNEVLKRLERMG